MFDIYEGQANIDEFDFVTLDRRTIDIKTAVFSNHTRLVVPLDQLLNIPKDFYVGIKLTINLDDNLYEKSRSIFNRQCSTLGILYICRFRELKRTTFR